MQTPAWYQGESLKRLLQGAAVGVVATLVVGFGWGGWMLGSSAKTLADSAASSAVVAAIAPTRPTGNIKLRAKLAADRPPKASAR